MLILGTGSRVSLHQSSSKLYKANLFGFLRLLGVLGAEGVKYCVILGEALLGELNRSGLDGAFSQGMLDEDFRFGEGSLSSSSPEYPFGRFNGGGINPCSLK